MLVLYVILVKKHTLCIPVVQDHIGPLEIVSKHFMLKGYFVIPRGSCGLQEIPFFVALFTVGYRLKMHVLAVSTTNITLHITGVNSDKCCRLHCMYCGSAALYSQVQTFLDLYGTH